MSLLKNQSYYFIITLGTGGEWLQDASSWVSGLYNPRQQFGLSCPRSYNMVFALCPRGQLRDTTREVQSLLATMFVTAYSMTSH